MSLQTAKDVNVQVRSSQTASERRITPSWTLSQLKARLEPVTGIPPPNQLLRFKAPGMPEVIMEAQDEDKMEVGSWSLSPQSEIYVEDTRPPAARNLDFGDLSSVEKYTMSEEAYEKLPASVLAWKKANNLGRFDPDAPEKEAQKAHAAWEDVKSQGIVVGKRCRLGEDSTRHGVVAYIGEVPEIPNPKGPWIGIVLDEPTGKNDGTVGGRRYFDCPEKRGIFVRPERVEIGDFDVLLDDDEDMEEM